MKQNHTGLPRGVYVAPWTGQNGELVLIGLTRFKKLVGGAPVVVPNGASRLTAADALWAQLDDEDPAPQLRVIRGGRA